MNRYRILESVKHGVEVVHTYEDLEIHHPSRNAKGLVTGKAEDFERGRIHQKVEGAFEEVRILPDGRELVKKDFVLSQDGHAPVRIPAPVAGFVHYVHGDATAPVRIYDRPSSEAGAKVLAQVLHMDPKTFQLKEGARVEYGQPLGVMSDTGTPGAIHAHVEVEVNQFRKYIRDIDNGVITPDSYPGKGSPREGKTETVISAGSESATLKSGSDGHDVIRLQTMLMRLGYHDAHEHPLAVDGNFGVHTEDAVRKFQRVHGLHVDGVVGDETRKALAKSEKTPLISERTHPDHPMFHEVQKGLRHLPAGTFRNETEIDNTAAALATKAKQAGITHIDHVMMNTRGDGAIAVQGNLQEPGRHVVMVDRAQAASQTVTESTAHLVQHGAGHQTAQAHVRMEQMEYRSGSVIGMRP